ncbi:hypothetical protein OE88DRAFT_1669373 [Heliocybe sulcata]|uniref:Extracellular membrane protein CFEM domain-containing protein n=1 Tax=Heliocybe sulcata TaxID=5364 RepID=A0A5C3MKV0_9AGAM|nr:hypothetical protein OE88DRAFT_1669373 [Heliocybe sulcata]
MRTTMFFVSMLVAFAGFAMAAPQDGDICKKICSEPPALRPSKFICECPLEPVPTTTATCDCSSTAPLRARQQCNCPIQTL